VLYHYLVFDLCWIDQGSSI